MRNRAQMMDDVVRIVILLLSGLGLVLLAIWYVSFCYQEITGTGQVVIDPLTIVTDDREGSDELGRALARMLQADLESRASEFQNAQQELALRATPSAQRAASPHGTPAAWRMLDRCAGCMQVCMPADR